jgi:membrane-associated phospholipid phosphatase
LVLSVVAATAAALVARGLDYDRPPAIDRRIRRLARVTRTYGVDRILWPLFPLGLPGGYITIAYALAHRLHRSTRRGGPAIVTSAWLGWLVHRAVKLAYERERPRRRNSRRRSDSYPSGHTTGATALALTSAYVLGRQRLISMPTPVAIGAGAPLLMGAYRVIADDHWATDVVGGWLLGGAIGLTCNATLADSFGGAAHHITVSGMKRRARPRRARSESPTYAG